MRSASGIVNHDTLWIQDLPADLGMECMDIHGMCTGTSMSMYMQLGCLPCKQLLGSVAPGGPAQLQTDVVANELGKGRGEGQKGRHVHWRS